MDLIAHSIRLDVEDVARVYPALHRTVRRFPAPVQLALAALEDVRGTVRAPERARLIALAPCQAGSPEVHQWVQQICDRARLGEPPPRMNPTHTLHVVDNLVLSAAAIALGNHEPGVGLGGAPGQAWEALEIALAGGADEVVLLAGDQDSAYVAGPACGVAIVLASEARGRVTVSRVSRSRRADPAPMPRGHCAAGLARWLEAPPGAYAVPWDHGDGVDDIVVDAAVRACPAS